MRTTVRLDDALLNRVKAEAAQRGETVTSLIEQGLKLVLAQSKSKRQRQHVALPVCHAVGGVLPGIDLNDSSTLMDVMDGRG